MVVGSLLLTGCGSGGDPAVQAQSSGVIDLSGVTPNWDKNLLAAQRFAILPAFNSDAVRDNETGLVWERSPQTAGETWDNARSVCASKTVGNRKGWRLPSMPELASLVDPSVAPPGPTLPPGDPFLNIQPAGYWSATSNAGNPLIAWFVFFNTNGDVGNSGKANPFHAWCVRGGMNANQY